MKISAGTLLYRQGVQGLEVLLVHASGGYNRKKPWSIPKGLPDAGEELEQAARECIIGLYRLTLRDAEIVLDKARGEPIYLILAMTPDRMLRMKPQNLVTGLPIAHVEVVS